MSTRSGTNPTVSRGEIVSNLTDATNASAVRIARILHEEYGDKGDIFYTEEWQRVVNRIVAVIQGEVPEPRELLCMVCWSEYPVWYAPSPLWNQVVRRPDGSDEWEFLCPTCFARIAVERGVDACFVLSEEVLT